MSSNIREIPGQKSRLLIIQTLRSTRSNYLTLCYMKCTQTERVSVKDTLEEIKWHWLKQFYHKNVSDEYEHSYTSLDKKCLKLKHKTRINTLFAVYFHAIPDRYTVHIYMY